MLSSQGDILLFAKCCVNFCFQKEREETAGPMWFNLPRTQMTPEIEQDLKIIKMRNVLDRTRHYKKNDSQELPKYFQVT